MSLIFPKKQPLYAPMLGTLGGGSARGFGRGAGGFAAYETGLWAMGDGTGPDGYGMVKYDTDNFDRLVTSGNTPCSGSYPSQMADTYRNSSGTVYLIAISGTNLGAWSSSSLNQISSVGMGVSSRGMFVYNGYAYVAPTNNSSFKKYDLSNISNLSNVANEYNGIGSQDWEGMVGVDGKLVFGGLSGWITVMRESTFTRVGSYRLNNNQNEITAMCYGANRTIYAGYTNGQVLRATMNSSGDLTYTHQMTTQNPSSIIEDLEVDRFGNVHILMRNGNNNPGYQVVRGTDLYTISYGYLPFNDPPAAVLLNDYMYVADHNGSTATTYKYYVPDVIAGTFSPTSSGTKYGPSTNTLLGSYDQSTIHELNLAQGGLAF